MDGVSVRFLLYPGERLLWEGNPEKRFRYKGKDCLVFLASLLVPCLSVALSKKGVGRFLCLLLLFLWITLPVAQALLRSIWRAKRYHYAVTDKRVMIVDPQEIQSLLYREIYKIVKDFRKDGSGTIWFRKPRYLDNDSYGLPARRRGERTYYPGIGFEEIADAEWVCRLIEEQIRLHNE